MRNSETEAKFLVESSAVWRRLARVEGIGPLRRVGSWTERQRNTYFDTADLRLHRAHAALKLRRVGSRAELTFKRELSYRAGVSQRVEITVPMKTRSLPFASLRVGMTCVPVRRARGIVGARPLGEVLTLWTLRRRFLFGQRSVKGRLELALDQVSVVKGGRALARHREVELENRGLPEDRYRRAVGDFRALFRGRLRPCRRSKYELGLQALKKGGNFRRASGSKEGREKRRV